MTNAAAQAITCTENHVESDHKWTIACDGIAPVQVNENMLAYRIHQLALRAYWLGYFEAQGKIKEALGL